MVNEHVLVCLSSAPSNAKIVRAASSMAKAYKGNFTALYIETPDFSVMSEDNKQRLHKNMQYAQELGAEIEIIYGDDVPYQIAEFARLSGVTSIVIGRSLVKRRHFPGKPTLTERLIELAPELDIHIIPDSAMENSYYKKKTVSGWSWKDAVLSVCILMLATGIGTVFSKLGFTEANIIMVYILGVLIISVETTNRIYSLISSVVSVLVFNFFFTVPRFTFWAYHQGYPVTFLIMFIAAFITSTLAVRLKNHAKQAAHAAYRTKILFDTNQLLQQAKGEDAIFTSTVNQITKLLGRDVILYVAEKGHLKEPRTFSASQKVVEESIFNSKEQEIAKWVFENNKRAGATTNTFPEVKCLYYAIRVNTNVYGVVGIVVREQPLDAFANSVLLSILGECALTLENEKNAREKEEAKLLVQNEQLRANLLRAISHDLRTPLTSISGNASNLLSKGMEFDEKTRNQMYEDMYEDSMWLINLVENLLSITRIEDGRMNLHIVPEFMDEVIAEALQHVSRKSVEYHIIVEDSGEFLFAKIDAKLIVQVIINIVDNAIKYSPKGSTIRIYTKREGEWIRVSVSDDGPGIPDEIKPQVFDMFFSGANKVADSRRSLGLGLYLCKSIIHAHGGEIEVLDCEPCGTTFTFSLLAEEVDLHE